MKTKLPLLLAILLPLAAHAADDLTTALQKGLFEEEANQNLPAAIQAYQALLSASDDQRKLAATALFRLGECHRKLGQTNDAIVQYQRLIRDFADQTTLATLSRQNLVGLGVRTGETHPPASSPAERTDSGILVEALRAETLLKQLSSYARPEIRRALPTVVPDPLLNALLEQFAQEERSLAVSKSTLGDDHPNLKGVKNRMQVIDQQIEERINGIMQGLAIKAAALRQQAGGAAGTGGRTGEAAIIDEEEQEIRRIQALIKDSPDLINAPNVEVTKVRSGELMVPKYGTLLHKAASLGQLRVVTFLLDHGADINARDQGLPRNTPLHWAANNGHRAMTELLLTRKADPNATLSDGSTPLLLAAKKSFRSVCETLLARGANPNLANEYGSTSLQKAAEGGDEATLRLLLAKGAEVNSKDSYGTTPLHHASSTNVARLLLERGADINAQNANGQSPLHESASQGKAELVELLLKSKADAKLRNKSGMTPLHLAASEGRANVIALLIQGGADPNDQESRTSAPLNYAIRKESGSQTRFSDYPATLTALLAGGANPNLPGKDGWTPLYQAANQGFDQMVEMLLKAGADPNLNSGGGYRPIHSALDPRSQRMLEALLSHGANADAQNGSGQIPLGRAAEIGSKEAVALLLKYKADPNGKSRQGQTPLHIAVRNNRRDTVDLLLAAKANPNATDAQGLSALDYAKQQTQSQQPGGQSFVLSVNTDALSSESTGSNASSATLADKLRQAGARDWAPRPGQITVTRRSTGKTLAVFTKGTNDWNRHSLLETMAFIYFGSASSFPFPDMSKLTITRQDPASGEIKEFTVNLPAKLAADDCKADFWLEWGDLIDVPEGEHRLDVRWGGLPAVDLHAFGKCVARKVTISVKGKSKEIEFSSPTRWMRQTDGFGVNRNTTDTTFRLRQTVLDSGLLLTSSDTSRVKVKRTNAASGRVQEWTFDLSKEATADDLWLRDGDVIEVPEK